MNPEALIVAFISFWSVAAVGIYLAVVGIDNLQRHYRQLRGAGSSGQTLLRRWLFDAWDAAVVTLGVVLFVSGMLFLYMVVYG
jgi:hypothetical protein